MYDVMYFSKDWQSMKEGFDRDVSDLPDMKAIQKARGQQIKAVAVDRNWDGHIRYWNGARWSDTEPSPLRRSVWHKIYGDGQ